MKLFLMKELNIIKENQKKLLPKQNKINIKPPE